MESIGGKGKGASASMLTELRRKRTLFLSYDSSNAKNFQSVSPLDLVQFQSVLNSYSKVAHKKLLEDPLIYPLFLVQNPSYQSQIGVFRITSLSPSPLTLYIDSNAGVILYPTGPTSPYSFEINLWDAFPTSGQHTVGVNSLDSITGLTFRNGAIGNQITLPALSNIQSLYFDRANYLTNSNLSIFESLQQITVTGNANTSPSVSCAGMQSLQNILFSTLDLQTLDIRNCSNLQSLDVAGSTNLQAITISGQYPELSFISTLGVTSSLAQFTASIVPLLSPSGGFWETNISTAPVGFPGNWDWDYYQFKQYLFTTNTSVQTASAAGNSNFAFFILGGGAGGLGGSGGGAGGYNLLFGPISNISFPLSVVVGGSGGISGGESSITDNSGNKYYATGGSGTQGGTFGPAAQSIGGPVAPSHFSHDGAPAIGTTGGLATNLSQGGVYIYGSGGNVNVSGLQGAVQIQFY